MKSRQILLACVSLALCMGSAAARADEDDCNAGTSLRLVNGRIHTMDKHYSIVSIVLIKNGRFAAVGGGGQPEAGDCARTVNLGGRTVVPGIIDSHNHIILLGLRPGRDARRQAGQERTCLRFRLRARRRGRTREARRGPPPVQRRRHEPARPHGGGGADPAAAGSQ